MPVPALYVCIEFTKLKYYSGMYLLSKYHSNISAQEISHEIVKLDEITISNVYLMTLTSLLQTWNYFLSTKVTLAVIRLYCLVKSKSFIVLNKIKRVLTF